MNDVHFRSGYGQAKADALEAIKEAQRFLDKGLGHYKPTKEQLIEIKAKRLALRWARALLLNIKSPR